MMPSSQAVPSLDDPVRKQGIADSDPAFFSVTTHHALARARYSELPKPARRPKRLASRRLPTALPPTHPGEMLLEEFLKPLGISQSALAVRLGVSFPRVNEVIRGKRAVTPDTALRLAPPTGMSADFWLGLQLDWDLWHALRSRDAVHIAKLTPLPAAG